MIQPHPRSTHFPYTTLFRSQDLYANDLRIHSMAAAGSAPNSTNTPKLALAVIGASAFLFVGYIALFCLPKLAPDQLAGLGARSEEHTSELQSQFHLVCRLLL